MNMENQKEAFVMLNHSLYHALLLCDLTMRQFKTALLILRLTVGCHRKWAKLIQADLQIIDVSASHAREVLNGLLDKGILNQNEKTSEYRLNEKYFVLDEERRIRFNRLTQLIGIQLRKPSQNGNYASPIPVTSDLPIEEPNGSHSGNNEPFQIWEDSISENSKNAVPKDNNKDNVKHNVKESIVAIDPYKKVISKVDPHTFVPKTGAQYYALEAWKTIEPDKPDSFNFYLWCAHKGLPIEMFDKFTNEVLSIESKNPGAMFNVKATAYLEQNNLI